MSNSQDQFKARIQDFLNFHFPNDKHTFKEYMNDFYVIVGEEKNSKLIFNVVGTSIYRLTINKEYFETIAPIFGLDAVDHASFEVLNDFLLEVNEHHSFKKLFEPIKPINFGKVLIPELHEPTGDYEVEDSVKFLIQPTFIKDPFTCAVQFDFQFETVSDNTKLKFLPCLCLTVKQSVRFAVGFDIDSKTVSIITSESHSYTDFFEKNTVLELDTHLDTYLHDFVSMLIEKKIKEPFYGKDMTLADQVNLLCMVKI